MKGIYKNNKQTPESVKFTLDVRERQNKIDTLKSVKKIPMGLSLLPKQFREYCELFFNQPNTRISKL